MLILIDLSTPSAELREPDQFTRFAVGLEGEGDLAGFLAATGLGRLREDGEHVAVNPEALRALAGPAADDAWDEEFSGMCTYAESKGWVEHDGGLVAHIDRSSGRR